MARRLGAAALALVLAGGISYAAGQGINANGPSISGQGSAQQQQPPNLTQGQEHSITDGLRSQQAQSNQSGYQGQLGSKVPDSMPAQQLPDNVTSQVPKVKGYYFVKLPDGVLLLDPDTKTVVEIVPASQTTGASPGANDTQSGNSGNNR